MMKISIKPSLLILPSLVLSFVSVLLPATKIQYQVTVDGSSSLVTAPLITKEGFQDLAMGDKYGRDAIPCINPRLEFLPSVGFVTLLFFWRYIAFGLTLTPFLLVLNYAISRKIPTREFLAWTAGIAGLFILISWLLVQVVLPEPVRSFCNFDDQYRIVSFIPNWVFIPLPAAAILLAYFGTRHDPNDENTVVTTT